MPLRPRRVPPRAASLLVAPLAALGPASLRAQSVPTVGNRPAVLSVGLAGGFTVPTKNADADTRVGPHGQGFALLHIPGLPPLRFNLGYSKQTFRDVLGVPSLPGGAPSVGATVDRQRETLSAVGGLTVPLFHVGPVRPYLTAGLGAFHLATSADSAIVPAAGTGAGTAPSGTLATAPASTSVNFGIDAGAGLALALGRVSAFAEGRVQNVYGSGGAIRSAHQIKAVPVAVGFSVGLF